MVWISSSIILIVSCKLQSSFSNFLLQENKQYLLWSVKTTARKKTGENNLTTIYKDPHLDLTFLWLEPKQFKRLTNRKTPILTNWRIKCQEKIQRATCTVFFNWMRLRTLSDYCDAFNTTSALVLAQVKAIASPRQKLCGVEHVEPFSRLINWPERKSPCRRLYDLT